MESEPRKYLDEHGIDRLFKDMLTCLLEDRPARPVEYMIEGLEKLKAAPNSPRPMSYLHFFQSQRGERELDIESLRELSNMRLSEHANDPLPADFCTARRQSVSAESYQPRGSRPESPDEESEPIIIPKSPSSRERIENAVKSNLLFRNLDEEQRNRILDAMFERKVVAGETVIQQGDQGDNFYVIESGRFQVSINGEIKDVLEAGKTFGELALMYNCPRTATITALVPGSLWAVDRKTFRSTVIDLAFRKRKLYEGFLRSVPLLSTLTDIEISRIADALEPSEYSDSQVIVKEGDLGEDFYIIVSGDAIVTKEGQEINRLSSGDYFGELALLENRPRTATVTSVGDLRCIVLSKSGFQRLLGPLKDILMRNQERYTQYVY